jgi:hypothetical protein
MTQWRLFVDYRKLNANATKIKFPMPIIDEFLDENAGAKFFTKLDLNSGFHQIRMVLSDEHKTTIMLRVLEGCVEVEWRGTLLMSYMTLLGKNFC